MQANAKGLVYGAVFVGGLGAVYLVFTLNSNKEVRVEQAKQHIESRIESKKFDAEFDAAWSGKTLPARNTDTTADEKELATVTQQQHRLEADDDQEADDFKSTVATANGQDKKAQLKHDLAAAIDSRGASH